MQDVHKAIDKASKIAHAAVDGTIQQNDTSLEITQQGCSQEELAQALASLAGQTPKTFGPKFFNQLFGGHNAPAIAADMLTPILNTSMYTKKVAGKQAYIEQKVLQKMRQKIGYQNGGGTITAGGSLSNMLAVVLARETKGAGTIYASTRSHYSIPKAALMSGIGKDKVKQIPVDVQGRINTKILEEQLNKDKKPMMIIATAGTTVTGAFDNISKLAQIARKHNVWLHVDGALGASLLLSNTYKNLLQGIEQADSVAWGAHKLMNVPLTCAAFLTKEKNIIKDVLNEEADYLFTNEDDPGRASMQCGRRNDALKLWAAWKYYGDDGYEVRINKVCQLAQDTAIEIQKRGWPVHTEPTSVCVCFTVPNHDATKICKELEQKDILISSATLDNQKVIRIACTNPEITKKEIKSVLDEIQLLTQGSLPMQPSNEAGSNESKQSSIE